ncbi:MAG: histidine kinase [Clostridia bacterium]|nr:histidine kinase [Clostridia bacterium]MDD6041978.1 histidine kinase [Clostridia bacterium]
MNEAMYVEGSYTVERVRFLHSQINSHFLYTTLETMRGMLSVGQTQLFKSALTQLASLYRYASSQDVYATIAEEVKSAQDYFRLISCIMPSEITLEFDIPQPLLSNRIPRMLLQPLIENARLHGFQYAKIAGGTIQVSIAAEDKALVIKVENDGAGIPAEKIMELNASTLQKGGHIGIANITERIRLLYPQTGSVEICSDGISGATVYVQF